MTDKSSVGYPLTRSKSRENRFFIFSVFHKIIWNLKGVLNSYKKTIIVIYTLHNILILLLFMLDSMKGKWGHRVRPNPHDVGARNPCVNLLCNFRRILLFFLYHLPTTTLRVATTWLNPVK